jgi:hypothetical protein
MVESKLGVVNEESLADDMEGWGDELVLKRLRAPGGEGPKEAVEIIRARVERMMDYWWEEARIGCPVRSARKW